MPKSVPLAVALGLSVALNLYLLSVRDHPASIASSPPTERSVERENASMVKLKNAASDDVPRKPAPMPTAAAPDASMRAPNCDDQLSLARAQVAVLRSELDHHLSLSERFDRSSLDATTERRLRPHLERLLNADAGISTWNLECRNQICKLHVVTSRPSTQWNRLVHSDKDVKRRVRNYQAMGGTPSQNPETGETLTADDEWMQLSDEDEMKDSTR